LFKSPIAVLSLTLLSAACGAGSVVVEKPKSEEVNRAVTNLWADDVRRVAQTGDWILTRSYSLTGDAIAFTTPGESLSHASVYDAESETVIEAISGGVREVPLDHLLHRNRYAIVVRPYDRSEAQRRHSVVRARSTIGADFDYLGLFGFSSETSYYCSELVLWAAGFPERATVITPSSLMNYGETIYFSGTRDDAQMQSAAFAREKLAARLRVEGARRVAQARSR